MLSQEKSYIVLHFWGLLVNSATLLHEVVSLCEYMVSVCPGGGPVHRVELEV